MMTVVAVVSAMMRTLVVRLTIAAAILLLVVLPMLLLMTVVLELVLELATHKGAGKSADDAMTGLVSQQATTKTSSYGAHQTAIALLSCGGVSGPVLVVSLLGVGVVGILGRRVLVVGSLLRELVRWVLLRILAATSVHVSILHRWEDAIAPKGKAWD